MLGIAPENRGLCEFNIVVEILTNQLVKLYEFDKWAKEKEQIINKKIQMTNKHMKRYSAS